MIATIWNHSGEHVVACDRLTSVESSFFGGQFECLMSCGCTVFAFADEIDVRAGVAA